MLICFYYSPIPPGYDFTYEFNITQHGTYWIHSHFMVCRERFKATLCLILIHILGKKGQYVDGLRAPLILHNTMEAYQYDQEMIVTLSGK